MQNTNPLDSLPSFVNVLDYHEFSGLEEMLDIIFPDAGLKVKELGLDIDIGKYVGVVYVKPWASVAKHPLVVDMITHLEEQEDEH